MARNGQDTMSLRRGGHDGRGWLPEGAATVFCVTANGALLEECARVAAVAGVGFEGITGVGDAQATWHSADLLMVGPDVPELPPVHRGTALLVGLPQDHHVLWQHAAALGIEHVAALPDAAGWLVEFLSRRGAEGQLGTVLGVVGGCGGAGASTTAALLAVATASAGVQTLLVDGDRLGGGLEARVLERPGEGLHWPDLASARGAINPDQLAASLPRAGSAALLSWPAAPGRNVRVTGAAVSTALDAARSAFELVVVDVGRGREGLEDFAWATDQVLIVLPGTLGAALSAVQLLHELPPVPVGAVIRGATAEGVDAEHLSDLVGCPLVARLPHLRRVGAAADAGRLSDLAPHRSVRRLAQTVLERTAAFPAHTEAELDADALAVGTRLVARGRRAVR
ncbi:hypothetical protein GCM10012320_21790 [Sinomonas cellulolyticus]|uniref:Rv3660c-like CheY-like N-terminal domain-containing protein n=1 Tax=Sinomonas cellulolyticus TaxID=2801916 RepID=A0ABS1K2K5_9MICC|nr:MULTISPECIES: septum site-determining protein Ssd [Sinomonas]MBL0705688.1 hypothetical protein [Sinomonas cellulolyticus]GHG51949.1 hypothetical protein GCM10012320_21790 [Sinomonas sp. KCTC 49339]